MWCGVISINKFWILFGLFSFSLRLVLYRSGDRSGRKEEMSVAAKTVPKLTADSAKQPPFKTGGPLKTETFSFTGKFDQYVISIRLRPAPTGQALTDSTAAAVKTASKLKGSAQDISLTLPYPVAEVHWGRDQSIPRQSASIVILYELYGATRPNSTATTAAAAVTAAAANTTATATATGTGTGAAAASTVTTTSTLAAGAVTSNHSCYVLRGRRGGGGDTLTTSEQTRDSLIELILGEINKMDFYREPEVDEATD